MSMLKRLFLLSILVGCVGSGFLLAINLGDSGQASGLPVLASPVQAGQNGIAANGQRNLLLVGVDAFESSQPQLKSVWLVLQIATHSPQRFTLVPLYPAPASQALIPQDELLTSFKLDEAGAIQPGFFEIVHAAEFWWSNYLVLDQAGLAQVIDLAGGINLGQGVMGGNQVITTLISPDQESDQELQMHTVLLQTLCTQSAEALLKLDAKHVFQLLGGHLRTDLEIERLIHEWQMPLILAGRPSCEFPTLQASQLQIGEQ